MPRNLLIIDTETTGLDPEQDQVVEMAAVLYSIDHQTTLFQMSMLLSAPENPMEGLNHIPAAALANVDAELQAAHLELFQKLVDQSRWAIAHNANFDFQWFDGVTLPVLQRTDKSEPMNWLCSMEDCIWPNQNKQGDSLINLALAHGVGVSSAHRALTDCQLIAALFDRLDHDYFIDMIRHALRPKSFFRAEVTFDEKDLAKERGFRFNPKDKTWTRAMADLDTATLPFDVANLGLVARFPSPPKVPQQPYRTDFFNQLQVTTS